MSTHHRLSWTSPPQGTRATDAVVNLTPRSSASCRTGDGSSVRRAQWSFPHSRGRRSTVPSPADLLTFRFGDGLATGPDLVAGAESAVDQALAPLRGQHPDLLCVFISGADPATAESVATRATEVAGARTTLGCSAGGVIGAGRGVENMPAVSAFAACLPGVRCTPLQL